MRRIAEHPILMASGSAGDMTWRRGHAHGRAPSCGRRAPPGPTPVAFTASSNSSSTARTRGSAAGSSTGRMSARFARPATLSNVLPMPTPTTSGGQAFAPFSHTQRTSSSTIPCNARARHEHGHATRVVRAAAFKHDVQGAQRPIRQRGGCRRTQVCCHRSSRGRGWRPCTTDLRSRASL